jgi:hypothetical protein
MNVKVTNLQPQPISLSNGVQLAAAGTKGSTREVAMSARVRKLGARELIFIHPEAPEGNIADTPVLEPGAGGTGNLTASTDQAGDKRSRK